ncbi:MAG: hypothetical protein M3364_03525 [Actinomycetota bacterium]|nr:hypothetical protein [Actinomycetota bacterium]
MSEITPVVTDPVSPPEPGLTSSPELPRERSDGDRKAMLAQSVANEVRKNWNVQSQNDFQAVMAKGKRTSHGLHVFLSLITLGFWIPVWVVIWYMNRDQHEVITVDPYGNVNLAK